MNYMKELNAFRNWLTVNELPSSAIVLWYTLMSINNMTMWKERFNARGELLRLLTGLSKSGVSKAREILIEHGLIECEKGKRGKAPIFKMVSLLQQPQPTIDPVTETQSVDPTVAPSVNEASTIHRQRQDETKTKTKNASPTLKNQKPFQQKIQSVPRYQRTADLSFFDELLKEVGS